MARPIRYEAAGAIYHVIARGDGGKRVFHTEADRGAWLRRQEEASEKFGWLVHAWVLMGNHVHFLLETPEPNLVVGMKWLLGVYTQGWNRRRNRRGHLFQGRYKAVVVNGEDRDAHYFRIVADYIHLNPVRAGMVGGTTRKKLRDFPHSSFPAYCSKRERPKWLVTEKVLRAFELDEGKRGARAYVNYLEERAKDRRAALNDESLKALRRGWYLGDKSFGAKVLDAIAAQVRPTRKKGSVAGSAARAHDEAEAERIVGHCLAELGLPAKPGQLAGRGRWLEEKALIASLVKTHTAASNGWVAARLAMGHPSSVSRAARRVRENRKLGRAQRRLHQTLDFKD
ncbi:MAG: transposase [Akkermansiaceae bacterium]|nr:transposase [Akkermansiaceae bacterium]